MSKTIRKPAPRRRRAKAESQAVRVRMYPVGFGDCFLLLIPARTGQRKVLIDCGSIVAGTKSMSEIVGQIISDITDPDGTPRLDVVVATHRHKDHISGFADRRWRDVEVKEVWMPWTEAPEDPQAIRIRLTHARLAAALQLALTRKEADQSVIDLALNAASNDQALAVLHDGFAGSPKRCFLPEGLRADLLLKTEALPEVFVHVLGPSRDESVIKDMDPPAGQSYLRMAGDGSDVGKLPEAFGLEWVTDFPPFRLDPEDEKAIHKVGEGREEELAALLDKAINGTSLMLLFQIGDACLLFPGDAQWGTWNSVLSNPGADRLLDKVTFYKIGHHGSHNATPIDFVEKHLGKEKRDDLWAMLSVTPYKKWPDIPRQPLLDRLSQSTDQVARSDSNATPVGFTRNSDISIEAAIPTGLA